MLARVGAWDWLGTIGGMPLGYALTGPIVDAVGTGPTLVGVAIASILLVAGVRVHERSAESPHRRSRIAVPNTGVPGV